MKDSVFRGLINFFSLREKVAKRGKKRDVLSPSHFSFKAKLLAPPRVRFLLTQKLLGTTAHFRALQFFVLCKRVRPNISKAISAYSAFAAHRKSVKHRFASLFRRMFAIYEQTSRAGEARDSKFRLVMR